MNLKEEKLKALTMQKEQLLKAKKNYAENSKDYRLIMSVIEQHDEEIRKLIG